MSTFPVHSEAHVLSRGVAGSRSCGLEHRCCGLKLQKKSGECLNLTCRSPAGVNRLLVKNHGTPALTQRSTVQGNTRASAQAAIREVPYRVTKEPRHALPLEKCHTE